MKNCYISWYNQARSGVNKKWQKSIISDYFRHEKWSLEEKRFCGRIRTQVRQRLSNRKWSGTQGAGAVSSEKRHIGQLFSQLGLAGKWSCRWRLLVENKWDDQLLLTALVEPPRQILKINAKFFMFLNIPIEPWRFLEIPAIFWWFLKMSVKFLKNTLKKL